MSKHLASLATLAAVAVAIAAGPAGRAPLAAAPLTEAPRLSAIYDSILAARFDEARSALMRACPPAPAAACDTLRSVALWWEIQEDLGSRALDTQFQQVADTAIRSAAAWTAREPNRAEAWFYLAGASAPLAQWRVARGERMAAARDGKRIKDALERALALDPTLQDAWFGIGLYHYYADVAPAALKVLRFLLLLPGGDRVQGLQEMLRARDRGELLRGEADFQMHWLYLWYEQQPQRALDLLTSLDARYPTNPIFLARIADVQHVYFHDHRRAADAWLSLVDRASGARVALPRMADARARVGAASELVETGEAARATALLAPVVRDRPQSPHGIVALAGLTLGDAYAAIGDRQNAIGAYNQALATAPRDDPDGVQTRARAGLARVRSSR